MLGVCYFPEHWPEAKWPEDFARMKALGLSVVRMGEFAWSKYEPERNAFSFTWMDTALELAEANGLKVVLCTPTATPPKWLTDQHPEILPIHPKTGRPRSHGGRRQYDFSSPVYRAESRRITEVLAKRYGRHDTVIGWQTDNEYACHDTAWSASPAARTAFQRWCAARYLTVEALNEAWGTAFWSQTYRDFGEIELPFGMPAEPNPAHLLAYRRFASDEVVAFNREQVEILRAHAPGRFVTHNFIPPNASQVDHAAVCADLDFASWDNYPLGFTDLMLGDLDDALFSVIQRTGHPDIPGFLHDLHHGLSRTRGFWVMEQQPGPVNWAPHNTDPMPGMVRTWTWQAFAHGADCVSYFRWRQVPFAQEQNHAGLLRPDDSLDHAYDEAGTVAKELTGMSLPPRTRADTALLLDTQSLWITDGDGQSLEYDYSGVTMRWYSALRGLGLDVDVITPAHDLSAYKLILIPCLSAPDDAIVQRLKDSGATLLFGPRSGAKTEEASIPQGLPPGALRTLLPMRVLRVESVRPGCAGTVQYKDHEASWQIWREKIEPLEHCAVVARCDDGVPALLRSGRTLYCAALPGDDLLGAIVEDLATEAGLATQALSPLVRLSRRGELHFAVNYGPGPEQTPAPPGARFLIGGPQTPAYGVSVWTETA